MFKFPLSQVTYLSQSSMLLWLQSKSIIISSLPMLSQGDKVFKDMLLSSKFSFSFRTSGLAPKIFSFLLLIGLALSIRVDSERCDLSPSKAGWSAYSSSMRKSLSSDKEKELELLVGVPGVDGDGFSLMSWKSLFRF